MMKGLLRRNSACIFSVHGLARFAPSRSRAAASACFVIAGMSQALRQASGLDLALSELSGLRAKVSALVCGSQ